MIASKESLYCEISDSTQLCHPLYNFVKGLDRLMQQNFPIDLVLSYLKNNPLDEAVFEKYSFCLTTVRQSPLCKVKCRRQRILHSKSY